MNRFLRRQTENNSLIPAILEAFKYVPEIFAFQVKAEARKGQRRIVPKGTPDILGVRRHAVITFPDAVSPGSRGKLVSIGRGFAIESKLSHLPSCKCDSCVAQRTWRDDWERQGGLYVLARSAQQAVDAVLGRMVA